MTTSRTDQRLHTLDTFPRRHLGPTDADIHEMLGTLGLSSLEALANATVPEVIRQRTPLNLPTHKSEQEVLAELRDLAMKNKVFRSFIGMGYSDCITPPVITAKSIRESGLVHPVHTLSGRDCTGATGSLVEFPDHGGRSNGFTLS